MHFTIVKTRNLARALLGLVLFAQCVVAAEACNIREANPVHAFTSATEADEERMPCHEQASENKNACLVHCTQSDQINADQATPVFISSSDVVLVLEAPAVSATVSPSFKNAQLALNSGPPIPIRFCSFLI